MFRRRLDTASNDTIRIGKSCMQVCKKNDIYIKTRAQCPIQNASRM
jgi:hypothetical protein